MESVRERKRALEHVIIAVRTMALEIEKIDFSVMIQNIWIL